MNEYPPLFAGLSSVTGPISYVGPLDDAGAIPASTTPPRLYRYLECGYALEALQKKRWKVGRIAELNDPLDCSPKLTNTSGFLPGASDLENEGYFKAEFAGNFGLLCYSAKIDSPVLWSHYADRHRGIAFGLDYSSNPLRPVKVDYGFARPAVDCREINAKASRSSDDIRDHFIKKRYSTKAKDWEYEEEFRHFIALEKCLMEGPHYFRAFPYGNLRAVILGAKCSATVKDIERLLLSCGQSHPIEIQQCRENRDAFNLNIEPVNTITPKPVPWAA